MTTKKGARADYGETILEREKAMKRICKGLLVIASIFLISTVAEAQFYRGEKLVEDWKAYKMMLASQPVKSPELVQRMANYVGYVVGVCDAYFDLIAVPPEMTVDQIPNAVGEYLDDHPEEWHEPAVHLVIQALMERITRQVPEKKKYDIY